MPSLSSLSGLGEGLLGGLVNKLVPAKSRGKLELITIIDVSSALDSNSKNLGNQIRMKVIMEIARQVASGLFSGAWDSVVSKNPRLKGFSSSAVSGMANLLGMGVTKDRAGTFRFRINPQRIGDRYRKVQTETNYGWGYLDLEHHGSDWITKTYNCTTGFLYPPAPILSLGITDIRMSPAYIKLKEFENYYLRSTQKLIIVELLTGYLGYFTDFDRTFDANFPRQMLFNITLKVHPTFRLNVLTGKIEGGAGLVGSGSSWTIPGSSLMEKFAKGAEDLGGKALGAVSNFFNESSLGSAAKGLGELAGKIPGGGGGP